MNVASINESNEGNTGSGRIGLGELIQQAGSDEAETQPATRRPVNRATNRNIRHVWFSSLIMFPGCCAISDARKTSRIH